MTGITRFLIALSLWLSWPLTANAEDLSGTLAKIRETGTITIGHRESSLPFSYYDENQKPTGYSVDLCLRIVDAVRRELRMDKLGIVFTPVSSATRIPLLNNGTIDLECGSTSNTAERQKQVAFTITHYVSATRYVGLKSSHLTTIEDLKGKTVVATSGTTNLKQIQELNEARSLGMIIVTGKDHAESFLMMETGRADAFALDDVLLAALIANSKSPDDFVLSSEPLAKADPYGIMLRRDDPAFKRVVDDAMTRIITSGEILDLYDKWFLKPVPPKNITLNLPMGDALKVVVAHPTDSADPTVYESSGSGYHWNLGVFQVPAPDGHGATYLTTLFWGLKTTLYLTALAWPLALLLGIGMGILRTLPARLPSTLSAAYVEVCRNTPLLAQMFLWYFVIPEFLPASLSHWLKTQSEAPFLTAVLCLGFYTSARIAEQVRAGIKSLASGQRNAALALGLTTAQTYRYILLPQALRFIFPPLTSELLNLVKNTSVALTIGVVELTARARSMQEYSFQVFEAFAAATVLYFLMTIVLTLVMRRIEAKIALPGFVTQSGGGH